MSAEMVLPNLVRIDAARRETFEKLMADHQQLVLRTAYRLLGDLEEARDAAQEVFLRLLKHVGQIKSDPRPWLYRVTVNVSNDRHRRRKPSAEMETEPVDPARNPEQALQFEERKQLLVDGLATLSERERAALVLRDIEGLPTREVAQILGVAEVTIRSQVSAARLKLAKYVRGRK